MTTAPALLSADTRRRAVAAWAKAIGASNPQLPDGEWMFVEREDLDSVVVVRIDQTGLAAAPRRVMDVVRATSPRTLLDAEALAKRLPRGAVSIGSADLLFTERIPPASAIAAVPARPQDVTMVHSNVSSAEWHESGLAEMDHLWAAAESPEVAATIAGYAPWNSALAQMGVVTGQQHRGMGFAYAAAAAATEAALADGLIPQWRSRQGNRSSLHLARRLGFAQLGMQSAVRLAP